jgi:hypothetical protein
MRRDRKSSWEGEEWSVAQEKERVWGMRVQMRR